MFVKKNRPKLTQGDQVLRDAFKDVGKYIEMPARRAFLQRSMTLGGLSLLTGCAITDDESVESALLTMSRFNDRVQGWLFDPNRLAPTYPESMITRPFPFNAFYGEDEVPEVDAAAFRLEVSGLVADRHAWTLAELGALPQVEQITRHICVEGWSAIGRWGGVPFATSCVGSAPTWGPSTWVSNARTTTTPASTWPRPCIPRPSLP